MYPELLALQLRARATAENQITAAREMGRWQSQRCCPQADRGDAAPENEEKEAKILGEVTSATKVGYPLLSLSLTKERQCGINY